MAGPRVVDLLQRSAARPSHRRGARQRTDRRASGRALREARYRTQAAASLLWPSLSATAAAQDEKLTYNGIFPADVVPRGYNWMGNASLDLSWELDFWGKNRKALSAAVSQAKAAQVDAESARLLLAVAVARSYVQLQGLSNQREIAGDVLRNRQESQELVRRRVAEGARTMIRTLEQATARVRLGEALVAKVDESLRLRRATRSPRCSVPDPIGAWRWSLPGSWRAGRSRCRAISKRTCSGASPPSSRRAGGPRRRRPASALARTAFYPNVNLLAFIGYESLWPAKTHERWLERGRRRSRHSSADLRRRPPAGGLR